MDAAAADRQTVLVVEDEPLVRDLVREILANAGYRVFTAAGAAEAEAAAAGHSEVDALVVDLDVPGGGGAPLARRLRRHHPRAAVVLVSGAENDQPAAVGDDVRFLAKPFSGDALRRTLADALARRPAG